MVRKESINILLSLKGCYGWIASPPNSHIDMLIRNVTKFEDRVFKEIFRLKKFIKVGLDLTGLVLREQDPRALSLQIFTKERPQPEGSSLQTKKRGITRN